MENNFKRDLEQEIITRNFIYNNFIKKYLCLNFDLEVSNIDNIEEQLNGSDFILNFKNNNTYYMDLKAQTNKYIENPTPTFCLELSWLKNKEYKYGWFLREDLKTNKYIFMWIHKANYVDTPKNRLLTNENDIKSAEIMIIDTQKIHKYLDDLLLNNYYLDKVQDYMRKNNIYKIYYDIDTRKLVSNKIKNSLTFTLSYKLPEQPINLVINKKVWEQLASAHYFLENNEIRILKENNERKE